MKKLFIEIKNRLETILVDKEGQSVPIFVRKWNNQLNQLMDENGAKIYAFPLPAVFVAFVTSDISQLGEGRQLYDPLIIELHILHWQLDAADGTFEQNLDVFDLKDTVYKKIQKFQPGLTNEEVPAGAFIRIGEEEDNQHAGVFHFVQRYRTTFIDNIMAEPVDGIDTEITPLPLGLVLTTERVQAAAVPYDEAAQYLAANETIVSNEGQYYAIAVNTPNPAGAFDAAYWELLEPNIYNFTPQ